MFVTTYCYFQFYKRAPQEGKQNGIQKAAWVSDCALALLPLVISAYRKRSTPCNTIGYERTKGDYTLTIFSFALLVLNIALLSVPQKREAARCAAPKKLMPPPPESLGDYFSWDNRVACYRNGDFREQFFYRAFLHAYAEDPFCNTVAQEVDKYVRDMGYETAFKELSIQIPNYDALLYLAHRYFIKYGIVIRIVHVNFLPQLLETLENEIDSPLYLGVITFQEDLTHYETAHITPLLFYFPGNQKREELEAVTLDSTGSCHMQAVLTDAGLCARHIFTAVTPRQGDHFSCHTGGIILLRNALLALHYHGYSGGFREVLQEGEIAENCVFFLPPEWDYTEQITNRYLNNKHLDIRSCFSKKTRKSPQKALSHRKKYTKTVLITCKMWRNKAPQGITENPPEGVRYKKSKRLWSVKYTISRTINTYLIEKSQKLAKSPDSALKD